MVAPFYNFLREAPGWALVLGAIVLAALGSLALWLGIDERTRVLVTIGVVLIGCGVAALLVAGLRGLLAVARGSRRHYDRHRRGWRWLLIAAMLILPLPTALTIHNYIAWRGIERECETALRTDDLAQGERAYRRGREAMKQRLLVLPSSLFDLWGPRRCESARERYPNVDD